VSGVRSVDVIVVGGGPAGAVAGALLARAGIETVVLARGHDGGRGGEVLLPHVAPILEEIGAAATVSGLPATRPSGSVTYRSGDGAHGAHYRFIEALPPALPTAIHVRRDQFDAALLGHARTLGAEVLEGWAAITPLWDAERLIGATVRDPTGGEYELRARALLDASGQQSFLASRMGWRFPYPRHRKAAIRGAFVGVPPNPDDPAAATVFLGREGWLSVVPLADGSAAVGLVVEATAVARHAPLADELTRLAGAVVPAAAEWLAAASPAGEFTLVQGFAHRASRLAGNGFCLVGDAAGFLDPLLYTGVLVAMAAAACAADDIVDALSRHRRVDSVDFAPTVALTRSLHRLYFGLVRALADPRFLAVFLAGSRPLRAHAAMVSLLAGDVLRPGLWHRALRPRLLKLAARTSLLPLARESAERGSRR